MASKPVLLPDQTDIASEAKPRWQEAIEKHTPMMQHYLRMTFKGALLLESRRKSSQNSPLDPQVERRQMKQEQEMEGRSRNSAKQRF